MSEKFGWPQASALYGTYKALLCMATADHTNSQHPASLPCTLAEEQQECKAPGP